MMKYENGGLKNQLAPRNNNPKLNKALLIINSILAVCALVISAFHFYYDDMTIGICMLLVLVCCWCWLSVCSTPSRLGRPCAGRK